MSLSLLMNTKHPCQSPCWKDNLLPAPTPRGQWMPIGLTQSVGEVKALSQDVEMCVLAYVCVEGGRFF